ncbi:transducin beta-like protein 3 [Homarus americanus]|uniref:transducin beta-like protein 3 n=1 Tax=Homarus americanus TaxID=6706 RepID=UPI001C450058|nr:transducin beta-like protein 3 [Homarus americanus]
MASKALLKSNFAVEAKYDAYFTGQRVQVTKDGEALLCECGDSVGVVSLTSGQVTGRIRCEEDQVMSISLAPDNSSIVVALKSSSIQQYQWPSLELLRSFRSYHRGPVTVMNWDTTSTLLITGAADSSARVWDIHQKYCTHSLKGASGVFGAAIFDSELVKRPRVYGAAANTIYVWTLGAGSSQLDASLKGHHSAVTSLEVTQDNTHLVSCGLDRVIILWELATMTSKKVVPVFESLSGLVLQQPGIVFPGAQAEDDHIYALVVGDRGIPAVWQVDTGREVWKADTPVLTPPDKDGVTLVNQVIHSPALDSILMTTYDHSIVFAKTSSMEIWKQLAGYNDQILAAVFVGAGESHLVVATNSIQLRIYNRQNFSCNLISGHTALVLSLASHPTQPEIFASSSHDNSARVWRLKEDGTVVCIASAIGHTLSIGCVTLARGFMVTGSKDMCIKKWTLGKDIEDSRNSVSSVSALSSTHTEKAHDKDINCVCVSVNYKLIATASQDKIAKVWDSDNLSLLGILRGHRRGIWCVQFSPVDEVLATASADATIKIWTISDFCNAATLEGHSVSVLQLSWLSQGQQILSTGSDGLLKLWTVKTRQCVQTFDEHEGKAWAMVVSEDERKVVTGGEDATLVLWKDVTQEEIDQALEEAARLAAEEQTLSNLIKDKKWAKAFGIAVRLNQPFRALKVMKALLDESPDQLPNVLSRLRQDQIASLLGFASSWNTKTKNSREAQSIINVLLKTLLPEEMEELGGWQQTLEGLLPYTERHLRRLSALYQSSTILTYMSSSISLGMDPKGFTLPPVMDNVELLQTIQSTADKHDSEMEDEDEDDPDLKASVKNSIMEVDSESETDEENDEASSKEKVDKEEDEGIEEGSDEEYEEHEDRVKAGEVPPASIDDLGANFVFEKVTVENSEDEEAEIVSDEEDQNKDSMKRKDYSIDQLELETKRRKDNRGRGIFKDRGGREKGINHRGRGESPNDDYRGSRHQDQHNFRDHAGRSRGRGRGGDRGRGFRSRGRNKGGFKSRG